MDPGGTRREEWAVEIYDLDTFGAGRLIVQPVRDREEAFAQKKRWVGYGYDTRRVLRRTVRVTAWEEVAEEQPEPQECACDDRCNKQCVYHAFKADASFRSQ